LTYVKFYGILLETIEKGMTMRFEIYHAKNPTFGFGEKPKFPEDYEKVAKVECDDLCDVFTLTNHIESEWTKNPEILELCGMKTRYRSTSVGDVVVDGDKKYICESVGWSMI